MSQIEEKIRRSHRLPGNVLAVTYGNDGPLLAEEEPKAALNYAKNLGARAENCTILIPPSDPKDTRRGKIVMSETPESNSPSKVVADGILLEKPGSAAMVGTRDCYVATMVCYEKVVMLHAGRDQILDGEGYDGVITRGLNIIDPTGRNRASVYCNLAAGIGSEHFPHDECPDKVARYRRQFGWSVFTDERRLTLDLALAIKLILLRHGVPFGRTKHDRLCTWSTPGLGSRRAERAGVLHKQRSNLHIVVKVEATIPP